MTPTASGRESAHERKIREEEEAAKASILEQQYKVATTAIVGRMRPQYILPRLELGEIPQQDGTLIEGPLMVLELGLPSTMLDVEFPASGAMKFALQVYTLAKAHEGQQTGVIEASGPEDVRRAADAAASAQRLREG
jgi:hypothetical protein